MSSSILKSLSSHMFDCLQGLYWDREHWREFKVDVEMLAKSLAGYTNYLQKSSKRTLHNQMSTSPIRQISENLTFQFLPICPTGSCSSTLSDLYDHLNASGDYEFHHVEKHYSIDSSMKYSLMKTMKSNGFPFPTALLTYTHGNNVGNLSFFVESAFQ